jgi:hypothetical protein
MIADSALVAWRVQAASVRCRYRCRGTISETGICTCSVCE